MTPLSFKRHRSPPTIIRHCVSLYARFTLSYRDIEMMLAERGVDVSDETIRRWFLKFGPAIAANLRRMRPKPSKRHWLWRAVNNEGEVLDFLIQTRRNAKAAKKLMKRLLKTQGFVPTRIVTDRLRSYSAAFHSLGLSAAHDRVLRANNRAENFHQSVRRREHKQQRFKSPGSTQRFLSAHAATYNTYVTCLADRTTSNFGPVRSMLGPSRPP